MMGMWPSRAVTFIENHDTGSTLNHWPFPANGLFEGYAYILTHPGTPCVFYDHFFGNQALQEAITALLDVRRRLRISARSEVRFVNGISPVCARPV
jgi:alpha-amylase